MSTPPLTIKLRAVAAATLAAACAMSAPNENLREEYDAFYYGDEKGDSFSKSFVQSIKVVAPEHTSYVKGDVTVVFEAPGMTEVKVFAWKQPDNNDTQADGYDAKLGEFKFDAGREAGEFVFRADAFPNGPTALRFYAKNADGKQDYYEHQLFNLGGVKWRQGVPDADPPGAKGMKLVFADDFDALPPISPNGMNARYAAHKTGGGDFSGWQFSDPEGDCLPFSQRGSYLRIHASKPWGTKGRSGILSSMRPDGTGVVVPAPSYFECRFVAHSAPGSWPAFWTLTKGTAGLDKNDPRFEALKARGTDELDVIEAYGGYGPKNPNTRNGDYHSVTHFWGQEKNLPAWYPQKLADGAPNPEFMKHSAVTPAEKHGEGSWWSWTPHTYGLAITETDTVYYFDNTEVLRHPTGAVSLAQPAWFLINYAIGGISGWQIDMERYGNKSDMWIDFVRVYCGAAQSPEITVQGFAGAQPARVRVDTPTPGATIRYTLDGTDPTAQSPAAGGAEILVSQPATIKATVFADGVKPSPPAVAVVTTAPGVPGSVGINFAADPADDAQTLAPNDIAGIGAEAQANWNTVAASAKNASGFATSDGAASPMTLSIEGEAKPAVGEHWGFNGNDLKLKRGNLVSNPRLILKEIPCEKYDIIVILGAGIHNVQGEVSLKTSSGANAYAFDYGWNGGKHDRATTAPGAAAKNTNYIHFENASGSEAEIEMTWKSGKGWTGISALQIIPRD